MHNRQIKVSHTIVLAAMAAVMVFSVAADEAIIQQEKLSFEKCLDVITTSENKLSIAPKIMDASDRKRIAVFTLVDGILKIKCDGIAGNVTVSIDKK